MQRCDALRERRVRHEQTLQPAAASNTEGGDSVRQRRLPGGEPEPLQRGDHLPAPSQQCAAALGAELPLPREPHDDDRGQNSQHQPGGDIGDEKGWTAAALGASSQEISHGT